MQIIPHCPIVIEITPTVMYLRHEVAIAVLILANSSGVASSELPEFSLHVQYKLALISYKEEILLEYHSFRVSLSDK